MTNEEREKLIEDMAKAIAYPSDRKNNVWINVNWPAYEPEACAALAIAEAAIRKDCAEIAAGFEQNRDWVNGSLYEKIRKEVAAAILASIPEQKP